METPKITPEQARAELARRELEKRKSVGQQQAPTEQPQQDNKPILGKILQNAAMAGKKTVESAGVMANTAAMGVPGMVSQLATGGKFTGSMFPIVEGGTNVFEGKDLSAGEQIEAGAGGMVVPIGAMAKPVLSKLLKYENELSQAQKAKTALDGIRNTLGTAAKIAVKDVENVPTQLSWTLKSNKAVNALRNPVYEIEFQKGTGVPIQTVGNLNKVKEALGDVISTPAMWEEAGKKELQHIKMFYGQVNDAMKVAAKGVKKPINGALDAYNEFMDNYNMVNKTIVDKAGNAMGNKLRDTFKIFAEPAYKEAWKEVSKTSPEIKKVMDSMKNRELLRNILKVGVVGATVEESVGPGIIRKKLF